MKFKSGDVAEKFKDVFEKCQKDIRDKPAGYYVVNDTILNVVTQDSRSQVQRGVFITASSSRVVGALCI